MVQQTRPMSAEVTFVAFEVFGNDHLLTEILLHLPAKSLIRFKLVSKRWHSLISDPHFCSKWESKPISGIFLASNRESHNPTFEFISLHDQIPGCNERVVEAPSMSLTFVDDPLGIQILHSCKGLFLCSSSQDEYVHDSTRYHQSDDTYYPINYYVYNPTTKQHTIVPSPPDHPGTLVYGNYLAFDPLKSPHYKIVRLHGFLQDIYQFEVYLSQTSTWRLTDVCFKHRSNDLVLNHAIFWKGAIHWFCHHSETSLCFNVDQEQLIRIPMPRIKKGMDHRNFRYFGVSQGHLYLIDSSCFHKLQFDVLEMETDYSKWVVKYCVDLKKVARGFPQMCHYEPKFNYCSCEYSILGVVRKESEEESYLVMYVCGVAVHSPSFLSPPPTASYVSHRRLNLSQLPPSLTAIWPSTSLEHLTVGCSRATGAPPPVTRTKHNKDFCSSDTHLEKFCNSNLRASFGTHFDALTITGQGDAQQKIQPS